MYMHTHVQKKCCLILRCASLLWLTLRQNKFADTPDSVLCFSYFGAIACKSESDNWVLTAQKMLVFGKF